MTERPILFSGPMVLAILGGRKTQTRRPLRDQSPIDLGASEHGAHLNRREVHDHGKLVGHRMAYVNCPYGQPGDRLWVRETTRSYYLPNFLTGEPTNALCGQYVADDEPVLNEDEFDFAWWYSRKTCPGIHMPRWASRITLEVVNVRVERLQAIHHNLAALEGEGIMLPPDTLYPDINTADKLEVVYKKLWDFLNARRGYSWDSNPWVWVVEFRRLPIIQGEK